MRIFSQQNECNYDQLAKHTEGHSMLLLQTFAVATTSVLRHREHLYFCVGVVLQIHAEPNLAFIGHRVKLLCRCFPRVCRHHFKNDGDWNQADLDGVGVDGCRTAVLVFLNFTATWKRKMTSEETDCMTTAKKEKPWMRRPISRCDAWLLYFKLALR